MIRQLHTLTILSVIMVFLTLSLSLVSANAATRYVRSVENYQMPDVTLINQDGKKIKLPEMVDSDKPVVVEFIFATCTTICPILSIGFTHMQKQLSPEEKVQLISVSIDPEYDTPPVMKEYLKRYNAKPGWDFLTGSLEDINKTMKAFDAFVADKMGHRPLIFLRSPTEKTWVRIDGLMSGKELMAEYAQLKK